MPITRTPMIDDSGSGTDGTILNNAWKQELYGQIDALAAGAQVVTSLTSAGEVAAGTSFREAGRTTPLGYGVDVPYAAGNFTASSGAWTVEAGDVATYRYHLVGKLVHVIFRVTNTSLPVAANELRIHLPSALAASFLNVGRGVILYNDAGGAPAIGQSAVLGSATYIALTKAALVAWAVAVNNTTLSGNVWYEVA